MIISHLYQEPDSAIWMLQSNDEHSKGVSLIASEYATQFGCGSFGYILGMLHDKGKEQKAFQSYIQKVSGYNPSLPSANRVKHAYVGAIIAKRLIGNLSTLISIPILGHHSGLSDWGEYVEVMKEEIPSDVTIPTDIQVKSLHKDLSYITNLKPNEKDVHHWIRLLYSCLVDADYLDTEKFMNREQNLLRTQSYSMCEMKLRLEKYLKELKAKASHSKVNEIRGQIQQLCLEESKNLPGFYSLTVPTGGGKTISSIVWAVNHALTHSKKRIIIAIPYTSIIVQTAEVLKGIFGKDKVLEHHSNVQIDEIKDKRLAMQMRLATENWDYPIIVTTNVQLFESMFSNKPSACRKLHNICNSVLILDEIQTLPISVMAPIVDTLATYQKLFGLSVLFTTASMPILDEQFKLSNGEHLQGLPNVKEIIPESLSLSKRMQRVTLHFDKEVKTYDEIAQQITRHDKVLCVVNTRRDAQELFSRLPQEGLRLHLSRMMCPLHIRQVINQIKEALKDDTQKTIRVISTQLIEAGVDLDFPTVFRQEAGLDSILQAAGRCNREGKLERGNVTVFSLGHIPKGHMTQANNARLNLPENSDWFEEKTMHDYFMNLYSRSHTFDKYRIQELLYKQEFQFKTAAEDFKLIDDEGSYNIVVCYENSPNLIARLKKEGPSYALMKELGMYTVNIRENDFKKMSSKGLLEAVSESIYFAYDSAQYDKKTGLSIDSHWLEELLML